MIYLLLALLMTSQISWADIFAKPADQSAFDQALAKDYQNTYYRGSYDYNPYSPKEDVYSLVKGSVSPGASRFNFHKSLQNIINREEFKGIELDSLMNQISNSSLMVWQYSSPSAADLYKHFYTNAYLRLADRYKQYESWESQVNDPIVRLRKQAIIGCIKNKDASGSLEDMDQVFQDCFDGPGALGQPSLDSLSDPSNGNYKISGTVNVTDEVLDRVNASGEDLTVIKDILPKVMVSNTTVTIKGPVSQAKELIAKYQGEFLTSLTAVVKDYQGGSLDQDKMSSLSVFGVPLTEGQVKNLAMFDDTRAYLAMNKIASQLAYLKTVDEYVQASKMLNRVMAHPAIDQGYKTLLQNGVDFVDKQIVVLKEEKQRLSQYADTMRSILDQADQERMKAITLIKEQSIDKQEKGVFKLNP